MAGSVARGVSGGHCRGVAWPALLAMLFYAWLPLLGHHGLTLVFPVAAPAAHQHEGPSGPAEPPARLHPCPVCVAVHAVTAMAPTLAAAQDPASRRALVPLLLPETPAAARPRWHRPQSRAPPRSS